MALLFMDSFDHVATADLSTKWQIVSSPTIVAGAGRRASSGLRAESNDALVSRVLPVSGSVAIVGVAFKPSDFLALASHILTVRSGSTVQVTLAVNASGQLQVFRNTTFSGTLLGTASGTLSVGVYAYLELKTTLHASAGTVVVRVNGAEVLNLTGVDTAASGTAWNNIAVPDNPVDRAAAGDYDDLYVLDGSGAAPWNNFLGDCRVDPRYPTGAGATTGWTPSTAPNWSCVDDAAPNGDTDYVTAASADLTDTYTLQDAPVVGGTLYGVQVLWHIKKLAEGACSVAPVVRHSGTDHSGTAQNPSTDYAYHTQIYATNPGTSAAWTEADFNAAEFGVKRTA